MNWDYIAGIFDGEGSTGVYRGKRGKYTYQMADLTISNNHLDTLQAIQKFIGCGRIQKQKEHSYSLVIRNHRDLARVVEELIPRCLIKREKLQYVLSFIRSKRWLNDGALSLTTNEELKGLYVTQGMSVSSIAKRLGCSKSGVYKRLRRWNISKPRANKKQASDPRNP